MLDSDRTFAEHQSTQTEREPFRNQIVPELFNMKQKEMPMLATALTLALLGGALAMIVRLVRADGQKILAALRGESWLAAPPMSIRPVMVRFSQRYPAIRPLRTRAEWRAAA